MLLLLIANLIIQSRLRITPVFELVDLQVTTHNLRGGKSLEGPSKVCWFIFLEEYYVSTGSSQVQRRYGYVKSPSAYYTCN